MKRLIIYISALLLISSVVFGGGKDDILEKKKTLENIEKEISKTQKNIDQLNKKRIELEKKRANNEQKIKADNKVIRGLNRELSALDKQITDAKSDLEKRDLELELAKRRYLGNIRQFYLTAHQPNAVLSEDPNEELRINRQIRYLSSLANFESENVELAETLLVATQQQKENLEVEGKRVSRLKSKKITSISLARAAKEKHEKDLKKVREKEEYEADKISRLTAEAEEMQTLINRLIEKQVKHPDRKSFFAALKGQIQAPFKGKVVETYGNKVDPVTNLKSFNPGITIKGVSGRQVTSVASGTIEYIGELRGYGKFVIINHDDRFFTLYAGLGDIYVTKDAYVLSGHRIATAGSSGLVKFEIRDGRNTVDPIEWIQIDSF